MAKHFEQGAVLKFADGHQHLYEVLRKHPQVRPVNLESVSKLGKHASSEEFIRSFWQWFGIFAAREATAKLPDPPGPDHVLNHLRVLIATEKGERRTFQLFERCRALSRSNLPSELAQGLAACGVLLVSEDAGLGGSACPATSPDAIARAVLAAIRMQEQGLKKAFDPSAAKPEAWRSVASQLATSQLPEALDAARSLPAFRIWGRSDPSLPCQKKMFPCGASKALRDVLREVRLDILDEEDMMLVELLHRMGVKDMPVQNLAEEALRQSSDVKLIAQLVKEDLGQALEGKGVLPSTSGKLAPKECLLWDKELEFDVPRRMSKEAGAFFEGLEGKLIQLGCRTELDQRDVLDLAEQIQTSKDLVLAKKLLKRLESHPRMNEICSSPDLRCIQWLPASTKNKQEELLAPTQVWQPGARALVGLVKPLVTADASGRLLDALGVQGECHVTDAILHQQLAAMVEAKAEADMVSPIYKRLQTIPPLEKWVWTKSGFQPLDRISKDVAVENLSPCLHRLREEWHALPVFERANQKLTPELVFKCLDVTLDTSLGVAAHAVHQVRVSAVNLLTKHRAFDGSEPDLADLASKCGSNLRMITRSGNLLPVENTFFHDMKWQSESCPEGMEEIHGDVSQSACARFGVLNLSQIVASECNSGEGDWLEVTGQHEPLTRRLKNILKDYPWQSLVKEMLQNAEDAGASKFKVLIDRRPRKSESLLTPQMSALQGPCIWFYNDAVFEEKDFQALVSLGQGSKATEKGKIGRHGLGFNAIFNITDLPSVLSGEPLGVCWEYSE